MRNLTAVLATACLIAACSGGPQTVTLTSASVDTTYTCPVDANNAPYDLHASVEIHNGRSSTVTIKSVTAELTLEAIAGTWLQKVGDKYQASNVSFAPTTVGAGAKATLKATIPSACTNGKATNGASHGDYRVTIHVATSAGTYSISTKNLHRLIAA
jgi:hypothetical protein